MCFLKGNKLKKDYKWTRIACVLFSVYYLVCINSSKINSSKRFILNINNNIDNLLQYLWSITMFEYDHESRSFVWPWNIVINPLLLWDKFWYYLQLTSGLNLIDVKLREYQEKYNFSFILLSFCYKML